MAEVKKNRMFSWLNPSLEIKITNKYPGELRSYFKEGKKFYRKTKSISKGIFAKEKIKKGSVLVVMGGNILTIEDENKLEGIVCDKPIEISENFSISPLKKSDIPKMPQHYINHSCNPNSGFWGQIFIVAMRNIELGEEIVYDYAMIMHPNKSSNSSFSFECSCGHKECRKIIKETDWTNKSLQKKYDGYFQFYLQEKINKKRR